MYNAKQVIVVRRDLKMRKGKIAAQSGHACVEAVLLALAKEDRLSDVNATNGWISLENKGREATPLSEWFANGVAKICVYVDSEEALLDLDRRGRELGFVTALIQDAGHTEFHGNPPTPAWRSNPCIPSKSTRSPAICRCINLRLIALESRQERDADRLRRRKEQFPPRRYRWQSGDRQCHDLHDSARKTSGGNQAFAPHQRENA